jgi:hypothetical protein
VIAGSSEARAMAATIRALADADVLPSPLDVEAPIPPVSRARVRRVPGENLWLYYRLREDTLLVLFVLRTPPVPIAP